MSRLFISHSSRNNDKAIEVRNWLAANGWDDVFLDLDPERGIVAGQRWKEALQQAAYRCELVLALVSAEWLASSWCKSEIDAARLLGKKIFVALIGLDKCQVPLDLLEEQFIDLSNDPQAYHRLKEGLKHAGLDPLSFPFEAGRRPYPGFAYFEEQDAAVFFGRDAQIVRGFDEIRRLVRTGVSRMLVILGASGSGKSSFLRAGLWPRLKRDDRAWLPLRVIRPERGVISGTYGLAGALQQIISEPRFATGIRQRGLPRNRPDIEDLIKTEGGLVRLFDALRDIGQVPGLSDENPSPPTIVLALDQAEELFNEEGREESERFVEILTRTLRDDPRTLVILAMRSDAFPLVQAHPSLAALPKDTFPLDTMLEGSYRKVIEDPARLVQPTPLRIDPQLTEALLGEISGQDALPLLAFTLAHLYENNEVDNEITLAGYDKLGRIRGVIDTAVKQAFAAGVAKGELPKDTKAQLALARTAFIPHLAQANAAGQFVRRVATLEQIPAEPRPLIDSFAEQRLLIKDRRKDTDGRDVDVVEVAHETLLRQPPFSDWLEEDREFLIDKQQLQNDLRDWEAAKPADKKGALLTGLKLSRMRAWLEVRPQDLTPQERDFGRASIEQADTEERRKARQRRIITRASIAAAVILACFAVVAWAQRNNAIDQQTQRLLQESSALSRLSEETSAAGDGTTGMLIALEALPPPAFGGKRPESTAADMALYQAWVRNRETTLLAHGDVTQTAISPDGHHVITASGRTLRTWDLSHRPITSRQSPPLDRDIIAVDYGPNGPMAVTANREGVPRLWRLSDDQLRWQPLKGQIGQATFRHILTIGSDRTERVWDLAVDPPEPREIPDADKILGLTLSADGRYVATLSSDRGAGVWDLSRDPPTFRPLDQHALPVGISPDGRRVVTTSRDGMAWLWDLSTQAAKPVAMKGHYEEVKSAAFSRDGPRVATTSMDRTVRLWDLSAQPLTSVVLERSTGPSTFAAFSEDGTAVITKSSWSLSGHDASVRIWDIGEDRPHSRVLRSSSGEITEAVFAGHGDSVISVSSDRSLGLWDVTGDHPTALPLKMGDDASYTCLSGNGYLGNDTTYPCLSGNGQWLLTASRAGATRLWDLSTMRSRDLPDLGGRVVLAVSDDGNRVLLKSNAAGGTTSLLDLSCDPPINRSLGASSGSIDFATFSPDGSRFVAYSNPGLLTRLLSGTYHMPSRPP